jgi:hypothetical protein
MIPAVDKGLEAVGEGYDGLIVIGPFNFLPFRISGPSRSRFAKAFYLRFLLF